MEELSLYILDLVQNSVAAQAKHIRIEVKLDPENDRLTVVIADDGTGMSDELLKKVTSPFVTTRKTRKVGLGLPMIRQLCEMCEGTFQIESRLGEGTRLELSFRMSHIDLPPMGSLPDTMLSLVNGSPEDVDFELSYAKGGEGFEFSTSEIREVLGGVKLNTPDVLVWIRDYIAEGIAETEK